MNWSELKPTQKQRCKIEKTSFKPMFRIFFGDDNISYDDEDEYEINLYWVDSHKVELNLTNPFIPNIPPIDKWNEVKVVMYGAINPPITYDKKE